MYAYIRGKVVSRQTDFIILDNQGIGYKIQAAPALLERFPGRGEEAVIHTHFYVREDTQALFGFPSAEELNMFELLLTVSGIGPKVASAIVGAMSPSHFALAVITGDIKTLTGIRGIGRKGAERMILELRDKLKGTDVPAASAGGSFADAIGTGSQSEAINALMVLGYSGSEAAKAVTAVYTPECGLEDLIRQALRHLSR
ncbi:MAG TPA: Holliday junction branch migration protein RuvA [Clostridiales bacterium]|nr:Holliday junction branch migration protein RuvA [Clostridiales bacterium]